MDTTKINIKMCEKAEEIQKEYKPKTGDFQANKILFKVTVYNGKYPFNKKKVWLPRQDQLQEMIAKSYGNCEWYDVLKPFINYYQNINFEIQECRSMEQLWLAFVMKEKYNKVWDGKDWIKNAE